ncbi:Na+/H+ antiporter subunit E [Paenibacillus sp. TRM 82003]|uniref:Na+/H+ antiporter subunit E n=1 Tax=Kineococcus sp. TRM81007 TaxID=2925831 RepID=UPI001F55E46A|nr:Na+/H+ antiporter subunit E [Kineococcus sp. TRM81007]MCI2238315.1 Na+/H+ antiporter subunit E [Kineococcus sp. TRM81007]MCI3924013.1 Na+/H+ antiporter subunit E [Paenibacillus sp. TRM 82003]
MKWSRVAVGAVMLLVWLALWGRVTALNVLGGVLVVLVLGVVFPLPAARPSRRPSPVGVVLLAGHVAMDLARSSVQVAWLAVRPGPAPAGAIVAVPLRDGSDAVLVTTAQLLTLVPGTLTVDVDVPAATLYVHVPVTGPVEGLPQRVREDVLQLEARVRRALPATGAGERRAAPEGGTR